VSGDVSDKVPAIETDESEIRKLERRYSIYFLQRSLHGDAIRWRELTAPNRRALDREDRE
jgi:hypothetical protein